MRANSQSRTERRGIVLVLVLAMLGLLALVGVTFATFSGQARINARNFAQSLIQPQNDELMDFALSQLINDTGDPRSAIHGHSLARDMYGNDAFFNGYLPFDPTTGGPFFITAITPVAGQANTYLLTTNIAAGDYNFYPYFFKRWIMRVAGSTANGLTGTVSQTFEILIDSGFSTATAGAYRQFTVVIGPTDGQAIYTQTNGQYTPVTTGGTIGTSLYNPTYNSGAGLTTTLPGQYLVAAAASGTGVGLGTAYPFQLDGRWLHAFGGSGMGANAPYANFRYNGALGIGGPNSVGMDEDYDACDLENWFLALQSADGQVIIPSFHRPANIRYDPNNPTNPVNDWTRTNTDGPNGTSLWYTSASRILRPVLADGNDLLAFPDLTPDPNTGKINYDVDNDGDGITDSVWLDLGYPARRDSRGKLYKPLFAFMVIGLNGRIPLNTAGNLAGTGATQAEHLGNSVSEVDPTYALQNAFTGTYAGDYDPFNVIGTSGTWPPGPYTLGASTYNTSNTQVDDSANPFLPAAGGTDVRWTQLRNLLAGTRPQPVPAPTTLAQWPQNLDSGGIINGDDNSVYGSWSGTPGMPYFMPNGTAEINPNSTMAANQIDIPITTGTSASGATTYYVQRTAPPVPGRWGEAASIPGQPFPNPFGGTNPLNLVQSSYTNPVRAGYSFDISDLLTNAATYGTTTFPRDAADDNFNAFDPYPAGHTGEIGDLDYYDVAGANLLPVERMRRWVTPADINGTGRVAQWNVTPPGGGGAIGRGAFLGADNFGRVQFSSYFRPAGVPGNINVKYTYNGAAAPPTLTPVAGNLGEIYFPNPTLSPDPFYAGVPNPLNPTGPSGTPAVYAPLATVEPNYLPDVTNSPFHGFEAYKLPNLFQNPGTPFTSVNYNPQQMGGMPIDLNQLSNPLVTNPPNLPSAFPTYDFKVNSVDRSDGVNEADETNLYTQNPLLDSPYGPSDLEWLYRQDDVDGATLSSRLSSLAPISFTNTIDGARRRRLFALDTWEMNNFVWANDNPGGAFAGNASFTATQSASFSTLSTNSATTFGTPTLAQRDKKINLNYPLPVSNDCNEPIRQKWINDTYQLLKRILPPDSVDTAEELVQLSQFVINIVDFRDPDGTMTHWVNPDVLITPGTTAPPTPPTLTLSIGTGGLDQYGMEYNPVAINEALAYSFTSKTSAGYTQTNRLFLELVNTLPAAYNANYDYSATPANPTNNYYGNASAINLGGFNYTAGDPYSGGCWDLVFTSDDPMSRPDPYRGELVTANTALPSKINYYGLIPLNRDTFSPTGNPLAVNQGDVTLLPVSPGATMVNAPTTLPTTQTTPPTTYFYVIGNPANSSSYATEANGPSTTNTATGAALSGALGPAVTQTLQPNYDPLSTTTANIPTFTWHPGILPGAPTAIPANYNWKLPLFPQSTTSIGAGTSRPATNFWVCLRRPANPFAPVSATNPMCVVDSMRFPYIEGTGGTITTGTDAKGNTNTWTTGPYNTIYSAQRLQPFRGGHAVAAPNATASGLNANVTTQPPDPRYGYTEQLAVPYNYNSLNYGYYSQNGTTGATPAYFNATNYMYHTLGAPNDSAENWDYLTFNDRDFTSVAELTLVPGCPPALFTKQFAEFAPSQISAADIFATVTPILTPTFQNSNGGGNTGAPFTPSTGTPAPPTLVPFATGTVPFLLVSNVTTTPTGETVPALVLGAQPYVQPTTPTVPVQPHSFPFLVDKFFYSGASNFYYPPTGVATDPSNLTTATPAGNGAPVVGGPASDGWFKMFDFFEVPSQMIGAIGPVAAGFNFDWARQDTKPGLLNINLIIDEEAFFSVFGRQDGSLNQTLLNSIELPLLTLNGSTLPYSLPLSTNNSGAPPIPANGPPVPLVVSAITASGAPNYVYPVTNQLQLVQHGFTESYDPIQVAINTANGTPVQPPPTGNRLKAAFAQFLWLRHGGSGYMFGYGNGGTGQNSAVATSALTNYTGATPAERYFHSLSYPDINYTIMRPAALPPSTVSLPAMVPEAASAFPAVVANAQSLLYQPSAANLPTNWYFSNGAAGANNLPSFYAPFVAGNSNFGASVPAVYSGDPGVRNPLLSQGYSPSSGPSPYGVYPTQAANTVPLGIPLPVNVAFPTGGAPSVPNMDSVVLPPSIPPRRLFQPPDAYGSGIAGAPTAIVNSGYNGTTILPPPVSNASDSGDPWINNQIPNLPSQTVTVTTPLYTVNNGFSNITWSGGTLYPTTPATNAPLPATGALPLVSTAYLPYGLTTAPAGLGNLTYTSNAAAAPNSTKRVYLGTASTGSSNTDDRQHPYFRSEMLQKAMNLTTVRTHQYAVWITVGFFEIVKQGDLANLYQGNAQAAFDIMGPEVGSVTGKSVRFRGFFLVDRTKITGFNPGNTGSFRSAVVYRKVIQ